MPNESRLRDHDHEPQRLSSFDRAGSAHVCSATEPKPDHHRDDDLDGGSRKPDPQKPLKRH